MPRAAERRPARSDVTSDAFAFARPPDQAPRLEDCYFYHTTTIPGHGTVEGEWDLAPNIEAYLGHAAFAGKRVLDVGAATGFLSFHMEDAGGEVVSYDLSSAQAWDIVPLSGIDAAEHARVRKAHIAAINNGYWLCHAARGSAARMAYGTVYGIDPALGPVDISVFGSILLHLRDPFLALHNAAQITRETMIVSDLLPGAHALSRLVAAAMGRTMAFKPRFRTNGPWETWWAIPPKLVVEVLGVLGFESSVVTYHTQRLKGRRMPMYSVVATRTKPTVPLHLP
jgi:SAM-dependent methyltransferase